MYQITSVSSGPNPPETHQSANPTAHPGSGLIFATPTMAIFSLQRIDFKEDYAGSITLGPSANYPFKICFDGFSHLKLPFAQMSPRFSHQISHGFRVPWSSPPTKSPGARARAGPHRGEARGGP